MKIILIPSWIKWLFGLLVFTLATITFLWLAGFMFFVFCKANPFGKSGMLTIYHAWALRGNPVMAGRINAALLASFLVAYGTPLFILFSFLRQRRSLHGEARFATSREIKVAGLMAESGIIVGKYRNRYLVYGGQQFVLLAAPTRSGKGVSMVIPNLLSFQDSVVVLDIKQENYARTSKFRAQYGQQVFLFNPFAEDWRTCRYNPLGYVRDNEFRVNDLIAIGEVFYPSGGRDAFFDDQARNLFVGLGLYLCETPELPRTIGEMLRQSSGKGRPIKAYIEEIIKQRNYEVDASGKIIRPKVWDGSGLPPLSMECVDALNRFITTSDDTRSSILASFNAPLGIWVSPVVDAATSANDFDLREVRKQRMSIYVGIPSGNLAEAARLVNLLFSQLINLNTKELPQDNPALKYQCLLVMDEFASIGQVGIIGKSVSYMAGFNLRLLTIIQSPAQLEAHAPHGYGRQGARTLTTNHACQILYAPREQQDAESYSRMLGNETVQNRSVSRQSGRGSHSESVSDHRRALLLPQEIKEIGKDREIIMLENTKPVLCDKIYYYRDNIFVDRLKMVSLSLKQLGKKLPSQAQLDAAVRRGELAHPAPLLDPDTHRARVQGRVRHATVADIENGIRPEQLALDFTCLKIPDGKILTPDEAREMAKKYIDVMDKATTEKMLPGMKMTH